jgi:hypothetical protein
MDIDPIPVWTFFEIPANAVEVCKKLAQRKKTNAEESMYWQRAASFLVNVQSTTVDELKGRDFDWMIKLQVQFEKDKEVVNLRSKAGENDFNALYG